jgi:hypothetical protein
MGLKWPMRPNPGHCKRLQGAAYERRLARSHAVAFQTGWMRRHVKAYKRSRRFWDEKDGQVWISLFESSVYSVI